ncbi:hypothetical protein BT63DRAFT_435271 [Microthyrium microscopicum]|uniref:RBR-type E3 ubiquitin transferase n=1 Tax=Microthyrium microscopicum TaxID=703497 RepID=A0A6A6USP0_9PEZI|nr:hypothetical protein BT63DRAFT_435271 [Microthyrium microscopicum]
MAEEEAFENWKICHKVNIQFHQKQEVLDQETSKKSRCIWCKNSEDMDGSLRSNFSSTVVQCLAEHKPTDPWATLTCPDCEVDLVQRISERKQECFAEGCRRLVQVDQWKVKQRLGPSELTDSYLRLLNKFAVISCEMCFDDIPIEEITSHTATPQCQHDPTMCGDCLSRYVTHEIETGNWQCIKCPDRLCSQELKGRDIRDLVSIDVFKVYDDQITRSNLAKNPNFRWCIGKCGNGQLVAGVPDMPPLEVVPPATAEKKSLVGSKATRKRQSIFGAVHQTRNDRGRHFLMPPEVDGVNTPKAKAPTLRDVQAAQWRCTKCSKLNCFRCKEEAHPGETCEQSRQLNPLRGDNERERKRVSKKCPKKWCGRYIGKTYGCVHMHCNPKIGGCGVKFCWKCKVIFPKINDSEMYHSWQYKHLNTCPMLGGKYETTGTMAAPGASDAQYEADWSIDPLYESGDSGSEQWR